MTRNLSYVAMRFVVVAIACATHSLAQTTQPVGVPQFQDGDRISLVGDSITSGGFYHSYIQLFYATRYPDRKIVGFNAGQSGGRAQEALAKLRWDIAAHKPTIAMVMLGMNDMGGEPAKAKSPEEAEQLIAEKIKKVEEAYGQLLDEIQQTGARLILVSPSAYDATAKNPAVPVTPYHDLALERWTARLQEIAKARGVAFVDVHTPLAEIRDRLQAGDPAATLNRADRVHPIQPGHLVMAYTILKAQGVEPTVSRITIDAATGKAGDLFNATVDAIERSDRGAAFTAHEKSLPFVLAPGAELGMNATRFNESLNKQPLTVLNLSAGTYELQIDDAIVGRYTADALKAGVDLGSNPKTPQYRQSLELARLNDQRHQTEAMNFRTAAWVRFRILEPAKIDPKDRAAVEARVKEFSAAAKEGSYDKSLSTFYLEKLLPKWDTIEREYAEVISKMEPLRMTKPHRYSLTRVSDAATRRQAFDNRDVDEPIARLATDLFTQIDLDRPAFVDVKRLLGEGQHREALAAYRDVAFKALAAFNFGVTGFGTAVDKPVDAATLKSAELLMASQYLDNDGKPQPLGDIADLDWTGQPGSVEFWASASRQNAFATPLLAAYRQSGDPEHLKQWAQLTDSWAVSGGAYAQLQHDTQSDNEAQQTIEFFVWTLSQLNATVAKAGDRAVVSESTFARLLNKSVREYPAAATEYGRHNPQNWTPHAAKSLVVTGLVLDAIGFRQGEFYVNRGMDLLQRVTTTWQMPDGSDAEQNFNYYPNIFVECTAVPQMVKAIRPDLLTPIWEAEMRDAARLRAAIMLRYFQPSPSTTMPPGNRYGIYASAAAGVPRYAQLLADDAQSVAIASVLQPNAKDPVTPTATNFYFPYGGYSFIRSGWGKLDQFAYMFSSPHPGNSDWRANHGNNLFVLTAFGREMLIGGEKAIYDSVPAPLVVDGKQPQFHRGIPDYHHRHMMQSAWTEPSPMRWLDTPAFSFTEGVYAGPYAKGDSVLEDVTFRRQALFLREAGAWIITDRIANPSAQSRRYEQTWVIPVQSPESSTQYQAFDADRIVIDKSAGTIRTQDENAPNLSIYQFGPERIDHKTQIAEWGDSWLAFMKRVAAPRLSERFRVTSAFEGAGDQTIVSLLYPRNANAADLMDVRSLSDANVIGFEGKLPGGGVIRYITGRNGQAKLSLPGVEVVAELIATVETNGRTSGVVLNCGEVVGSAKPPYADFAFEIVDGKFTNIVPIHRPLAEVVVGPKVDAFVDSVDVSLASEADTEIRYTTDGSDPSADSVLYAAPIHLTDTTMVKSRAYRKRFAERSREDPTFVGPITSAVFEKKTWHEPVAVQDVVRGLAVSAYEGPWQDLYQLLDQSKPSKTGTTSHLFDANLRTSDSGQAFRYDGYIEVPEDGVYTFHAPYERTWQHIISGHDLRVKVAGIDWQPSARRHAMGTWSIALRKGLHPFRVDWIDHRSPAMLKLNKPEWKQYLVWPGAAPTLSISGPGDAHAKPLTYEWFRRPAK